MTVAMTQDTFHRLRAMIYAKSGLEFPESKKYLLESRLKQRLANTHCRTYEEYFNYLRFDPNRDKELIELFNCVTTNETYFFRDHTQIDCFRQLILPHAIKEREKNRTLRMWCAGCSSGEEPFTLAMVVAEEFPSLAGWNIEILATDISEHILALARRGVYGPYSVRNVPPTYLRKYFAASEGQYTVGPTLRKMVKFSSVNLFDSVQMRAFRDIDVIFCRNVLIYFDQEAKRKIVTSFYDALLDSGVLVIGFSESLSGVNRLFRPLPWNKTVVYGKASSTVAAPYTTLASAGLASPSFQSVGCGDTRSGGVSIHSPMSSPIPTGVPVPSTLSRSGIGGGGEKLKREPR